jgi:hypothetical protein
MSEPREYTEDEIREKFIKHIWSLIDYWHKIHNKSEKEKMEGLAFSILAALDGGAMALPSFIVAPMPAKADKEFYINNNMNYYPYNDTSKIKGDIAGSLHELFFKSKPLA